MHIQNALVFTENQTFEKRDVFTAGGRILTEADWKALRRRSESGADSRTERKAGVEPLSGDPEDFRELDADGLLLLPGLVDIHSHGAMGRDFSDAEDDGLLEILAYQRAHGITSYCPTSMSLPEETLSQIFASAARVSAFLSGEGDPSSAGSGSDGSTNRNHFADVRLPGQKKYARIAGVNMEGPFLDPVKKGAHQETFLRLPDPDFFNRCNERSGNQIRLVTIAPNLPGAMEFIRAVSGRTVVSLGHTSCDYDTARRAFDVGASHLTHLYNAMPDFLHRDPGPIGAALDSPDCMAELIADGIHSHDSALRAAFALFPGRVVLISDSMRAVGLEDGTYTLGGQDVQVRGHLATLSDGTIAGSCTNLYDCMLHAVDAGVPAEQAIAAATANPAKSIGIYREAGSVSPGKRADLLLADPDLTLRAVL